MPLISDQLPNLMNGVSQQAVTMRLPSQAKVQVNGFSSIVDGNNKRQPTKHLAKMTSSLPGNAYVHTINRDVSERYSVVAFGNTLKVFDLDGVEKTVTFPDGNGYITTADPRADLHAVTVADYTFIVNTTVTADKAAAVSAVNGSEGLCFIKAIDYDVTYRINIDGTQVAAFRTDKATATNPSLSVAEVITDLVSDLTANLGAGWLITDQNPVIHKVKDDGTDFILNFADDRSNTMTEDIKGSVLRFTDLPTTGIDGQIIEVTGDEASDYDNYYLKFTTDNSAPLGRGSWEETVAPGIEYQLDPATMPHELVRMPSGDFEFRQVTWGDRTTGNLETAPWPSFVGKTINDIYFDRKRLCLLADDNVIMSGVGEFFSFFPATVVTVLDDGPIDVSAKGQKVSILKYAVTFNERVVLFSDQTQFVLDQGPLLASKPPAITAVTEFESDTQAQPVGAGKTLFFTSKRGSYTSGMEYYVLPDSTELDASDVTKHVPRYVPANVFKMAVSPSTETVLVLSSDYTNRLYVYKYYWRGTEKMQSSWSYWEFADGASILNVDFIKDVAYLVVEYADGVHLECMDISEGQTDPDATFVYRLDRRVDEASVIGMSYDAVTDRTTFDLPYTPDQNTLRVVSRHGTPSTHPPAVTLDIAGVAGTTVTMVGDITGALFYVGQNYEFRYDFSDAVLKTSNRVGAKVTVQAGRLTISKWHCSFSASGYFRAVVSARGRPDYTYVFTGKKLGTNTARLGEMVVSDGSFSFPVKAKAGEFNISIINDSFLPSSITSAEWEGRYERSTSRT